MLLFSTILPAQADLEPEQFYQAMVDWNAKATEANRIEPLDWNGEMVCHFQKDNLSLEFDCLPDESLYGARFLKSEDGINWRTDAILFGNVHRILIQLDRTYSEDAANLNQDFSTPMLISVMMDNDLFAKEDVLPYSARPWLLNKSDRPILETIFFGDHYQSIPVVLITGDFQGNLPVNAASLAWRLKGAAHVLVLTEDQEGPQILPAEMPWWGHGFGTKINKRYQISVTYPNREETTEFFRPEDYQDRQQLQDDICSRIFHYNLQLENGNLPAWMVLKAHKIQRQAVEETRQYKDNEASMNEVFDLLNEDVSSLTSQIQDLQQENQAMLLSIKAAGGKGKNEGLLTLGQEQELYPGEIQDFVLEAIRTALKVSNPEGRKAAIYEDLLKANSSTGEIETRSAIIRDVLGSGDGLDKHANELKRAGFTITGDHKHYKLVYGDDGRYTFSFGKTPSDYRAAKNNISIVLSKLFK